MARMAIIIVRVRLAVGTTGARKALTPLLTALTPVIAVQPLAKACSSNQRLGTAAARRSLGRGATGSGRPPDAKVFTIRKLDGLRLK
jgi:hypothetical protein